MSHCLKPSPYKLPLFIGFLDGDVVLIFSMKELCAIIQKEREFIIQRYIASTQGRAGKVRVTWGALQGWSYSHLLRKTTYPFNVYSSAQTKPPRLRSGSFVVEDNPMMLKSSTTQQLRFPVLYPACITPSPTKSISASFTNLAATISNIGDPYTVCFAVPGDAVQDDCLKPGLETFATEVLETMQKIKAVEGLEVTTIKFDILEGSDNLWYFLDLKVLKSRSIEERVQQRLEALGYQTRGVEEGRPLRRTLGKLQSFFLSDQPLVRHKPPYIPRTASRLRPFKST